MTHKPVVAALAAALALIACEGTPVQLPVENTGIRQLAFTATFEGANGKPVAATVALPKKQSFDFQLRSGTLLWGDGTGRATVEVPGFLRNGRDRLVLNGDAWASIAAKYAEPWIKDTARIVRVTPPETRVARIVPYAYTIGDVRIGARFIGEFSFFRDGDGRPVTLVYFDRACRLEGVMEERSNWILRADLQIPGPGFHALALAEGLNGRHQLVLEDAAAVIELVTRL
jgi:hypothetical protein